MSVVWSYLSPDRISQPAVLRGKAARHLQQASIERLVPIFWAWKLVVLVTAFVSPGPGYDTSSQVLLDQYHHSEERSWFATIIEYLILRLTRWDAVYFASGAAQGQVYEQEWAFSWLLKKVTSIVAGALLWPFPLTAIVKHAIAGVLISHVSHLLAVISLYRLVHFICPSTEIRKRQLAFTTACLHVISPAGIFLSTPFGEAPFALFNFLGLLCYAHAVENRFSTFADAYQLDAFWTVGAGLSFAVATMIRSNGLLSGMIFAWDLLAMLQTLPQIFRSNDAERFTRLIATLAAGAILALGFAAPQLIAYLEYCTGGNTRPWCTSVPPSIYSFVQAHYWDVGFLRYWKISNLPLFALALPIGWLMVETSFPSIFQAHHINRVLNGSTQADQILQPYPPTPHTRNEKMFQYVLPRFALPQLILVGMAATSFHCQIINRISSGYPVWYLNLAIEICVPSWGDGGKKHQTLFRLFGNYDKIPFAKPEWVFRAMMVYAVVQGGLYAAFLPPA